MRVVGLPSSFYQLAKTKLGDLPADAQERLRWVSCWQALRQQGLTSSAAAEALGLPRSTLYRWDGSLRETGPEGLCTKSGRPAWNRSTLAGEVFAVGTLGRRAPGHARHLAHSACYRPAWGRITCAVAHASLTTLNWLAGT